MSFDAGNEPNPYAAPTTNSFDPNLASFDGELPLATRGERFAGAFLDGLILLPIVFGAGVILGIVMVGAGIDPQSAQFNIIASVVGGFLGAVVFIAIHGYFLATRGQTIGKMALKTKIVSESTGEILPLFEIILKRYVPIWILSVIPFIGSFVGFANAIAIFRENRKCIHDDIAGTKVVKLPG